MRARSAAAAFVVLCLACAPGERTAAPAAEGRAEPAGPQMGGTLVRRLEADVTTLNPALATSRYERQVANYLFTPLIYLDRDLQPIEGLANAWEVSKDGLRYRFELNRKATFSDGRPVRASDVVFTLRKIADPRSEALQVAGWFEQLDLRRTRALDEATVEVAFRQPLAAQLIRFNELLVLPEHVYGKGSFRNDHNALPVGSGPYRLVRRTPGREIVLEKRADYWGEPPYLQKVVLKVIADHATAWNALRKGEIDETFVASETWLRESANPKLAGELQFLRFYTLNYNYLAWNNRDPILADRRVRRALASCVPLDDIVQNVYRGTARAMSGPFTPDQFAFNPAVPVIRHDPAEARRLLAAAGWRDANGDGRLERRGRPLDIELLVMSRGGTTAQFAQMLQQQLASVGVTLSIRVMDGSAAIERILAGDYQAAYLSWDLDPDPDPFAIFHSSQFPPRGQNFVFYSNPVADRLIEAGRRELDRAKRKDVYWKLHEILAADQPYTWTVQSSSRWAVNRRVRGTEVSAGYGLYLWYPGEFAWWVPAGSRRSGA